MRDRLLARSVFLVLLAVYTLTLTTQPDVLDGEVEFQTTSSLVRRCSFALGGTNEAAAIIAARDGAGFNVRRGGPGREDQVFSWFGVGQAYVAVPFYLAGEILHRSFPSFESRAGEIPHRGVQRSEYFEHLLVGWRNALLGALTAWLLVHSALRVGAGRRAAWLAGLTYGLCTFAWPQARSTFNSIQTTFFLFAAFHFALETRERQQRSEPPRRTALACGGAALGGAFLTRSLSAPAIAVIGLLFVAVLWAERRSRGWRAMFVDLGWFALPALLGFGVFLVTNLARFGDPFEQGYSGVVSWKGYFNYPLHHGLAGLLASPGQGLVWMAPGALLAAFACVDLLRRHEFFLPLALVIVAAAVLVPVALTVGWHGAWGYGPRYVLPLVPFLWLGVALALDKLGRQLAGRLLAAALFLLGFVVALGGVLVDTTTHLTLAVEAARLEWPDVPGNTELDREEERFQRIHRDLRFAAPWAHWRILFHRLAGRGDSFPVRKIFLLEREEVLTPPEDRDHGFRHLAWVDFAERLGGPLAPLLVVTLGLAAGGAFCAFRGFSRTD